MDIAGRTFLVTGGGSGLGGATARRLVAAGAKVVIADIQEQPGRRLAEELGAAQFVTTDVTDEASVRVAIKVATETLGDLRGVVNCAGIASAVRVVGKEGPHSLDVFQRIIGVNLIGTFNVIRLAAEVLSTAVPLEGGERGVIVNTASVAAYDGQIGQAAYSASKGGVVAMTLPIARELARFGIRVMTIVPGLFDTPLMQSLPEEAKASLGQQVPFPPRLGHPSEFAALVQHICENQMLNGEAIRLDGAIRMAPK
ncbi:MAG: 3-hydroxyacyl-CoA dehydrogenase [Pirellulaceae bacterium]|nr:3-hydroxyacyl-CoA dehydrogenase [Pirellulaceae bacterium]